MTASTRSKTAIKKVIVLLLAAVLVIGVGFALGKPLLSLISSRGEDPSSQQNTSSHIHYILRRSEVFPKNTQAMFLRGQPQHIPDQK